MSTVSAPSNQESVTVEPAARERLEKSAGADPGRVALELGLRTLAEARELDGAPTFDPSALLLYRSALILFLSLRRPRKAEAPATSAGVWTALEELPELKKAMAALTLAQQRLMVITLNSEVPELELLVLSREEREQLTRGLRSLALALGEQLAMEAYGVRGQRIARRLKIAALALCLVLPLGWALLRRENLALDREVVVSSRSPEFGVDPRRVVDGMRVNLGFHTEDKGPHTVTVDLGKPRRIRRVDVFNRADCCQERAVPLRLEVSTDGRSFRKLLVRVDPFSLWKAEFPVTEARYVRLVLTSDSPFHLSEIEVY